MNRIPAKKSLGQHFLIDPKAHQRIAAALGIETGDFAIEIGPGTGLLTTHLLQWPLEKLIAFELDGRAIPLLQDEFRSEGDRFELRERDFLEANLADISSQSGKKLRITGNIPYYITSPILFKLIDERRWVRNAVLLVQQEVAERLTAKPRTKAYGIPTVLANFFADVEFLFRVPRGAFRPVPNVDSAVIRLNFENDYLTRTDESIPSYFEEWPFRKLVRASFATRRKTIRNNLKAYLSPGAMAKIEAARSFPFLSQRAEELTIHDFLELFTAIHTVAEPE